MTSKARSGGSAVIRPQMILALMAAVALATSIGQEFYIHPAQAANEVIPNSPDSKPDSKSFANPRLLHTLRGHTGTVKSLAFSPNGKLLVSGGGQNEGIIYFWNLKNGKRVGTINRAHQASVDAVLISPDGKTLVSCGSDYKINFWNLKNLEFSRSFAEHTGQLLSLVASSDSKVLVSGGLDGIRLWDLPQQRPLSTLVRFDNAIYTLAISPDGQTLASGDSQGVVKLWNLSNGKLIQQLQAHSQIVTAVAFTPNGERLVTSSRDKTIKIWDVNNGVQVQTLTGHDNWVNAIAINPDGQTLASAGKDGIKLWDLNTGELKHTLDGHSDWVSAIAFSADGKMLASGGFDQKINIWQTQ
ncbi:WD40 repeat domain-containing protein [Trichormus variabilis]|uniref:WD40 repeat domain-containing protein n=1 Tax=Anabaena variabilis TaxID=264691 RepID=UPI0026D02784